MNQHDGSNNKSARTDIWCPADDIEHQNSSCETLPTQRRNAFGSKINCTQIQTEMFDPNILQHERSWSIYIQSLCGYDYTDEKYQEEVAKLDSYGFIRLRSGVDENKNFIEIWYLPGIPFAKGDLRDILMGIVERDKEKTNWRLERVLEFLRKNVRFGTLDVSVQKLYAAHPD